jgi:dTDP-4-dehydrorhamnose 3,5-epimerase
LSAANHRQLYIPPGFAHGFLATEDETAVVYKCSEYYHPQFERTLLWNDPQLGIEWPLASPPLLSDKDRQGRPLAQAECYQRPCDRTLRLDVSGGLHGTHAHTEVRAPEIRALDR